MKIEGKTEYHEPTSCNKCGERNEVDWFSIIEGFLCEAKTKYRECGFEDSWSYGFFESSTEMLSNCRKYYN